MAIRTLSATFPVDIVSDPWAGLPIDETITVDVEEIMPGGRRFSPFPVQFRITTSGATIGDTPDTALGIQSGPDGVRGTGDPVTDIPPYVAPLLYPGANVGFAEIDPTFVGLHYVIHTGDTGNYRNDRAADPSHRSKAFQYGQNPGHVYSSPGTYTGRSVYVYDDTGKWGTWALPDLVVKNPDDEFVLENVIVVSNEPGETWLGNGIPAHDSLNRFTNLSDAFDRFYILRRKHDVEPVTDDAGDVDDDGNGVRISVRPGTTYNEYANTLNLADMRGRALFDTWGQTGTIEYDESGAATGTRDQFTQGSGDTTWGTAWKGWKLHFGYDVANGTPTSGWVTPGSLSFMKTDERRYRPFTGAGDIDTVRGLVHCFDQCDIEGCAHAVFSNGVEYTDRYSGYYWNDCLFTNNNDYLSFQPSNYFMIGCQLIEEYGTELGTMGRNRLAGNQRGMRGHRNVRETTGWVQYIRASFIESRGGWSGQQGEGETLYYPQPLLRLYESSNVYMRLGKRMYFCDSVFLGPFNIGRGSYLHKEWMSGTHSVVENCLIVKDPSNSDIPLIGVSGKTAIRNNEFLCLNTPYINNNSDPELSGKDLTRWEVNNGQVNMGKFTQFIEVLEDIDSQNEDMRIQHNTYAMMKPDAEVDGTYVVRNSTYDNEFDIPDKGLINVDALYNVIEGHNVNYAPNLSPAQGPAMDTLAMPAGVRVLDVWIKTAFERKETTLASTVGPAATTPPIAYPIDFPSVLTTGSDYTGSGNNNSVKISTGVDYQQINIQGGAQPENLDTLTINHDLDSGGNPANPVGSGTHFTATNRSADTWPTGTFTVILDRGTTSMTPDKLIDMTTAEADLVLHRPTTPEAMTGGVPSTLFDFAREIRPSSGFAISPAGTNEAGHLLSTS